MEAGTWAFWVKTNPKCCHQWVQGRRAMPGLEAWRSTWVNGVEAEALAWGPRLGLMVGLAGLGLLPQGLASSLSRGGPNRKPLEVSGWAPLAKPFHIFSR